MVTISIERARPNDRDAVSGLLGLQLKEHGISLVSARLHAGVEGLLREPSRGFALLAQANARAIGLAIVSFVWTVEHGGLSAWLDELYVEPEHRLRGLGTRLLAGAIDEARGAGCAALDLEVDEDHARAANMYLRAGFRRHRRSRFVLPLT